MDRKELRALLAAATPGPWSQVRMGNDGETEDIPGDMVKDVCDCGFDSDKPLADAALIVALRNHAEEFLDALDAAERKLAMREISAIDEIQVANEERIDAESRLAAVERENARLREDHREESKRATRLGHDVARLRNALTEIRDMRWHGEAAMRAHEIANKALAAQESADG